MSLNDVAFRRFLGFHNALPRGGQELILPEIMALLIAHGVGDLWMPFEGAVLAGAAFQRGIMVRRNPAERETFDALYFGTPTIVNDRILFPECDEDSINWDLRTEREAVRTLCSLADEHPRCSLIISGLGSGDVSEEMRIDDMRLKGWSMPKKVAWKDFGDFQDSVFMMKRNSH